MVLTQFQRAVTYLIFALSIGACQPEQAQQASPDANANTDTSARSCIISAGWGERTPYHYRAPDGSVFGIDIDVLTYLASKAGCAMRYRYIPERQQIERLQAGDVEVLLGQYRSDEQVQNTLYSDPYRNETYDLHVISASPVHRDDLGMLINLNFNLGLTRGYSYEDPVATLRNDLIHKSQFVLADDSETNINNLLNGKVDGILEENTVVRAIADRELVEGRVEHLSINAGSQGVFLLFNTEKVSEDIIARFNLAITQMKKEGVYQQIVDRHS